MIYRHCTLAACMVAALLGGCAEGSGPGARASAEPTEIVSRASVDQLRPAMQAINTVETVDASTFGAVGDGVTLNTEALQRAFGTGGRTVIVREGDYVTSALTIPDNTVLLLSPGVTLRDSGTLGENQRLINISSENVRISALGARVVAERTRYVSGEQRHGVYIFGAHNVLIEGLESAGHGGDGFYIGGPPGNPSSDIAITGCLAGNNRRQGMSITAAMRVYVADCEFTNTRGTAPEFGLDLEPNDPVDPLRDIVIVRPRTAGNAGGGILILLNGLAPNGQPASVFIVDHVSSGERPVRSSTGIRANFDLVRYAVSQ